MSIERLFPQALRGRPLLGLTLAFCCGILLCYLLRPALSAGLAVLLGAVLIALILCLITRFTRWQPLLICGLALGFFLCAAQYAELDAWPVAPGEYAEISGKVKGAPVADDDGVYRLRLAVERVEGEPVASADVYLKAAGSPPLAGSRITAEGYCLKHYYYANPGAFDYREYLAQQGIAAEISAVYNGWVRVDEAGPALSLGSVSQWLRHSFEQALAPFSPEQRALVRGVFLGDDSGLDRATRAGISMSGMAHVFAVSGLHVGYLVLLVTLVCGRGFSRRKLRFGLTLFLLLFYLSLCGWTASVLRASLMALILLAAELFMEENDPLSSLSAAALLCLSLRPLWLFSVGFQLSFAAALALFYLGPLLCRLLRIRPDGMGATLCYSLAAVLGTAPLICHYFFYVPWWGWLLSPLVIAAAGVAVVLCLAALTASVFRVSLAAFILQGAVWVMQALAAGARLLGSWHISGYSGSLSLPWLLPAYAALLAAPLAFRRLKRCGRPAAAGLLALALLIPLAFSGGGRVDRDSPLPHTLAQVTFLDVGQGDCALVRTADGSTALIDGGGLPQQRGYIGAQVVLPYLRSLGLDRIDLMVSSHPDLDHSDGLISVLEELPVGELIYSGATAEEDNAELLQAAARNGCSSRAVFAGDSLLLGEEAEIRICSPLPGHNYEDGNAASVVMTLTVDQAELLFCGDAKGADLAEVTEDSDIVCQAVKLPHHGSMTGFDEDFYEQIDPRLAVISVGAENAYGHPDQAVVEYWQNRGELYRTDLDGAITVYTDGQTLAVSTEKKHAAAGKQP